MKARGKVSSRREHTSVRVGRSNKRFQTGELRVPLKSKPLGIKTRGQILNCSGWRASYPVRWMPCDRSIAMFQIGGRFLCSGQVANRHGVPWRSFAPQRCCEEIV